MIRITLNCNLFFGIWAIMTIYGKLSPNTLNHGLGNTKSNSNSSTPYLTSNEAILMYPGYLIVELYLFERVLEPKSPKL